MFSGVCLSYFCIMWPERHTHTSPRPDRIYSISSESFEGEGRVVVNPLRACWALRRQSPPVAGTQPLLNPRATGFSLTDGISRMFVLPPKKPTAAIPWRSLLQQHARGASGGGPLGESPGIPP